jgi:hypothetical protein
MKQILLILAFNLELFNKEGSLMRLCHKSWVSEGFQMRVPLVIRGSGYTMHFRQKQFTTLW